MIIPVRCFTCGKVRRRCGAARAAPHAAIVAGKGADVGGGVCVCEEGAARTQWDRATGSVLRSPSPTTMTSLRLVAGCGAQASHRTPLPAAAPRCRSLEISTSRIPSSCWTTWSRGEPPRGGGGPLPPTPRSALVQCTDALLDARLLVAAAVRALLAPAVAPVSAPSPPPQPLCLRERSKAMDDLGLKRYCCRRMVLTHVDLIDKLLAYQTVSGKQAAKHREHH